MGLDRRHLMLGSGALLVAGNVRGDTVPPATSAAGQAAAMSDDFFLSPRNPIANRDQRDLETLAIQLQSRPDIQVAIKRTADIWAAVTSRTFSAELWAAFPQQIADYCFRSILMAANSDPNFPKVLRVYSPAGKWMGNEVPSSKWGSENPDNAYRIIPVEYGARYVIHGQRQGLPPSYVTCQLVADTNTSVTVGSLEQRDMKIGADGSFVITLDETPRGARRNHIQLTPDALYVFIRDSMGDWRQTPDALRVERLTAPMRAPLTLDELAARAARIMHTGVPASYYWLRLFMNLPPQSISRPMMSGSVGGLVSQLGCSGRFVLRDDDAVILTLDALKADYHSVVLCDMWGRSLEYRSHPSVRNNATLAPDADGRISSVISLRDPGVHNWLDTVGWHEVQVCIRWQGLPAAPSVIPGIDTRVVKLAELDSNLPAGVRRTSADERSQQRSEQQALFDRRFIDT